MIANSRKNWRSLGWMPVVLAGAWASIGCGDDDKQSSGPETSDARVYVMASIVYGPEATTSFVAQADDLDEKRPLTLDEAVEVGDGYTAVFADGSLSGRFFAQDAGSVLTRFRVEADGSIVKDGAISFEPKGLSTVGFLRAGHVQFVSPTKAYLMGNEFGEIIEWNPETLELGETISVPEIVAAEDETAEFSFNGVRKGDKLYFTYNYTSADWSSYPSRSRLVVIDTKTNAVTSDLAEGCGSLQSGVLMTNGDIIWSSGYHAASVHRVRPDDAPAPCFLRVKDGEDEFDDAFLQPLAELVGERPAGALAPAGGDMALLRVYDEEEVPVLESALADDVSRALAWRWWSVDLDGMTATEITSSAFDAGPTTVYEVEGETYVIRIGEGFASSTVERVEAGNPPEATFTIPGVLQGGIVRVR